MPTNEPIVFIGSSSDLPSCEVTCSSNSMTFHWVGHHIDVTLRNVSMKRERHETFACEGNQHVSLFLLVPMVYQNPSLLEGECQHLAG